LYDEIGAQLTEKDWMDAEEMKESDFSSSEAASIMIKMEQNAGGSKNYLNELLQRPPRQRQNLIVEDDDVSELVEKKKEKSGSTSQ